jgi:hypothetical protein
MSVKIEQQTVVKVSDAYEETELTIKIDEDGDIRFERYSDALLVIVKADIPEFVKALQVLAPVVEPKPATTRRRK